MTSVKYEKDSNNIAHLILDKDNAPANLMDIAFADDFAEAAAQLAKDNFDGVIIRSTKSTFFAGGDINMLFSTTKNDTKFVFDLCTRLKLSMRIIENCGKPVVACIAGAAMGGGWEIALCAHHRIAISNQATARKIQLGLPEVTLGLLPGAGGVTRMVRLLGIQAAMPYLLKGKSFSPEQGIENGLIHSLVDNEGELLETATQWIKSNTNADETPASLVSGINAQPWDIKGYNIPNGVPKDKNVAISLPITPALIRRETHGTLPAPELIYATMIEGAQVDFDSACRIESRYFTELAVGQISKNIINTFWYNLKEVKAGFIKSEVIEKIKFTHITILGAGLVGQQLAYHCAARGISVTVKDTNIARIKQVKNYSQKVLEKQIACGHISVDKAQRILELINSTSHCDDLIDSEFVIDTVCEIQCSEHESIQGVNGMLNKDITYRANISSLPITDLSQLTNASKNSIHMNFLPSINNMQVVEINCSENVSDSAITQCHNLVLQLNRIPITGRTNQSSYTTRVMTAFVKEGIALIKDAHPASIENAAYLAGFSLGPLAMSDELSLSLLNRLGHLNNAHAESDSPNNHPAESIINDMIKNSRLGKSDGAGFYNYGTSEQSDANKLLFEGLTHYNTENNDIPLNDIKERLLFIMVIETVSCIEEGVISSTADANVGAVYGIGFPQWTGGTLQFINQYGLQRFITRAEELRRLYGERFQVPTLVNEMLNKNKFF